MGKSKKRILNKISDKNTLILKREEIIKRIVSALKSNRVDEEIIKYINLFGIKTEELTEAGAVYEELSVIKMFLVQ